MPLALAPRSRLPRTAPPRHIPRRRHPGRRAPSLLAVNPGPSAPEEGALGWAALGPYLAGGLRRHRERLPGLTRLHRPGDWRKTRSVEAGGARRNRSPSGPAPPPGPHHIPAPLRRPSRCLPVRPGAEDAASFPAAPLRGWPTDPGGDNPGSSGPPAKHS